MIAEPKISGAVMPKPDTEQDTESYILKIQLKTSFPFLPVSQTTVFQVVSLKTPACITVKRLEPFLTRISPMPSPYSFLCLTSDSQSEFFLHKNKRTGGILSDIYARLCS
jgi:hypothetical protein